MAETKVNKSEFHPDYFKVLTASGSGSVSNSGTEWSVPNTAVPNTTISFSPQVDCKALFDFNICIQNGAGEIDTGVAYRSKVGAGSWSAWSSNLEVGGGVNNIMASGQFAYRFQNGTNCLSLNGGTQYEFRIGLGSGTGTFTINGAGLRVIILPR
jgi:hypothetical protein